MSEQYISKEVYAAETRRIDERIDTILGRIDDKLDAHMSKIDTRFARMEKDIESRFTRMEGRIDKMESRLNGIETFIGWTIGLAAIVITIGTFIIQVIVK